MSAQLVSSPERVSSSLLDSPGSTFDSNLTSAADAATDASPTSSSEETAKGSLSYVRAEDGADNPFSRRFGQDRKGPASTTDKYIDPGQQAPQLTSGDKVRLGLRDAISPFAAIGWLSSAAYSQALDSTPNYGQGWGPFGQRLGAAAARGSTEGVFSDSVFAPLFHEDPRYYRMGPGQPLVKRTVYAATRALVTKSDSGRHRPNFSLLAGNVAGSILTNAYYPQRNRSFGDTAQTFAGSVGGSALGFVVSEFLSDTLGILHLKKSD